MATYVITTAGDTCSSDEEDNESDGSDDDESNGNVTKQLTYYQIPSDLTKTISATGIKSSSLIRDVTLVKNEKRLSQGGSNFVWTRQLYSVHGKGM